MLCAPGPSLIPIERQPGLVVAGLTKTYPIIKPDIWCGLDTPHCYDRRLWAESFIKIARAGYQDMDVMGRRVCTWPNTFFADHEGDLPLSEIFRRRAHDVRFLWKRDSLTTFLHILVWMGAREIYLNGFDLRDVDGQDYAAGIPKQLTPELRDRNQRLFDGQVSLIKKFAIMAKDCGISVISVTDKSPLNDTLPYCEMAVALAHVAASVPRFEPLMHSFETPKGLEHLAREKAKKKSGVLPFSRSGLKQAISSVPVKVSHVAPAVSEVAAFIDRTRGITSRAA